jgi:flagellar biosynthesis protein FliQ
MKKRINQLLSWFEDHFNFVIELIAFIGGIFCIGLALFLFVVLLVDPAWIAETTIEIIFIPGIIGFFGVMILFALRITRYMTNK